MSKHTAIVENIVAFLLGIYLLFNVFSFIAGLPLLADVADKLHIPNTISMLIVVVTAGFGINIGIGLLQKNIDRWMLIASLVNSLYLLILQLILTITPAKSACKCLTFPEALGNISDWSRVELVLGLFVVNLIVWILYQKFKTPNKAITA